MTTILVALASVFAYGRLTKTRPTKVTYALATAAAYVAGFAIQLLLVAYAQGHLFTTQTEVKTFNSTAQGVLIVVGVATAVLVAWLRRGSPTKVDADSTPPSTRSRREHVTAQPSEYAQAGPALSSGFADLEIGDLVSIEPSRGSGPIVGSVATMWLKGLSVTSGPSMPEAGRSVSIRFEDIKTVARLAALPPADTGATTGLVDDSQSEAGVLALVNATDCAVHDLVPEIEPCVRGRDQDLPGLRGDGQGRRSHLSVLPLRVRPQRSSCDWRNALCRRGANGQPRHRQCRRP